MLPSATLHKVSNKTLTTRGPVPLHSCSMLCSLSTRMSPVWGNGTKAAGTAHGGESIVSCSRLLIHSLCSCRKREAGRVSPGTGRTGRGQWHRRAEVQLLAPGPPDTCGRSPRSLGSLTAQVPLGHRGWSDLRGVMTQRAGPRSARGNGTGLCPPIPPGTPAWPYLHLGILPGVQADGLHLADLRDVPVNSRAAQTDEHP